VVNVIDSTLVVLIALFALRGYFKGLFREGFSLAGLLLGFMVAVRYDEALATRWIQDSAFPLIALKAAAFIAIFLAIFCLFSLAGWLLQRSIKILFLKTVSRTGGAVLGLAKGTAIVALAVFIAASATWTPRIVKQKLDASYLAPPLRYFAEGLIEVGKVNLLPQETPGAGAAGG
jgi:membrane protein required for colicin V production